MSQHIGSTRKDAAQKKFKKKLEILEGYLEDGLPEGAFVPKDETSFRLWESKELGLERIGSPNTLSRPYNRELRQRLTEILKELAVKKKRKIGRAQQAKSHQEQIKKKDRLIKSLTGQYHATKDMLVRAQQQVKRLEKRVSELIRDNAELVRQFRTMTDFRSIRGGINGDEDNDE